MEAFSEMMQINHQDRYMEHYASALNKLELQIVRVKDQYRRWNMLDPVSLWPPQYRSGSLIRTL